LAALRESLTFVPTFTRPPWNCEREIYFINKLNFKKT
jgi:hypothetical protein